MAYSLAITHAISILLYMCVKSKAGHYEYLTTKSISQYLNIPAPTVAKILKSLNVSGLTITKEGAKGGIALNRMPSDITLLDIFMAIEQERPLFKLHQNYNISGDVVKQLRERTIASLDAAESAMKASLKSVTLEDLMRQS